jgi:hypothetical protein
MNIKFVREAVNRQPFEPFVIRLADGRSVPVRHREFAAVSRRRVIVIGEDESSMDIEPFMIVSIDKPAKKSKRGNGHSSGE